MRFPWEDIRNPLPSKVYYLGGIGFSGKIIMQTDKELLIELPCSIFIRVAKELA